MRLMFDVEFNLGIIFVGVLTTLFIWDRIERFSQKHTMQPPQDVDLDSDTESETSIDEVDT